MADESLLKIVIDAENRAKDKIAGFSKDLDNAKDKIESMKPVFQKMALVGTVAFGAIVGVVGTSLKAFADSEAAMGRVDAALKTMNETMEKSGTTFDEVKSKILEASRAAIQLGFDDEDTAESITKFYQRTGDLTKAIELNNLTMDLARAKQVDLGTATNWVNMVLSGSGRILKQYGIAISEESTPLEQLMELQKSVGGQAEIFAGKMQGQTEILQIQLTNLREEIGEKFAPILANLLSKITPVIEKTMEWIEKNPDLTQKIIIVAGAIAGLVAIIGTLGLLLPSIITGIGFLSAAFLSLSGLLLGPIGIAFAAITATIGLVGYTIYYTFKNWKDVSEGFRIYFDEFKNDIINVWGKIKEAFQRAVNWIKTNAIEPLEQWIRNIDYLLEEMANTVSGIPGKVKGAVSSAVSKVRGFLGFQEGGIVPGPIGAPFPAIVHGGEAIIPSGRRGLGNLNITITGNTFMSDREAAEKIGDMIINKLKFQMRF